MKLKNAMPERHRLNYHGPIAVKSEDVSFGFKTANAYNTNRPAGNVQRVIDVKCVDLHRFPMSPWDSRPRELHDEKFTAYSIELVVCSSALPRIENSSVGQYQLHLVIGCK